MVNSEVSYTSMALQQQMEDLQRDIANASIPPETLLSRAFESVQRTLQALQTTEARNRALMEAIPDLIFRLNREGVYLEDKPAENMVTLLPSEGVVGKKVEELLPPKLAQQQLYFLNRALQTNQVQVYECQLQEFGRTHHEQVRLVPVDEEEVIGLIRNMTKRKQVEQSLRSSEARFRTLAETTPALVFVYQDFWLTYANPAFEKLTGYTQLELLTMDFLELIHPDFREEIRTWRQKWQTGGAVPSRFEIKILTKDNREKWIAGATAVFEFQEQEAVMGTALDISERKQAEQALKLSETRFRTLAETTPAAIFMVQETQIRYVNPAAEKITGYSREELLSMDFWQVAHPDSRESLKEHGLAYQQDQSPAPWYEAKLLTKSGDERWVYTTLAMTEFEGRPTLLGTAFDISQLKQFEMEREELLAREKEQRLLAETLGEVFLAFTSLTDYEAVLDEILRQIGRIISHSAANIMLLDGHVLRSVRWQGYDAFGSKGWFSTLRQSLAEFPLDSRVIKSRLSLVIPDTHQNPEWVIMPQSAWIRSSVTVPIIYLNDRVLGLLRLDSDTPFAFSDKDIRRLLPLANAAAIALENARLYDQAQQDLAERKLAEAHLRHLASRNQALLDAIPDSFLYFNDQGQLMVYRLVNDNGDPAGLFGPQTIGAHLRDMCPPEISEVLMKRLDQALKLKKMQTLECQLSSPLGLQDYEIRIVASGDKEALVIARNITDRKRAERQAIQTERLAALGQLAATLAHEINNPMQAIQSHLDLLLKYPLEPEQVEQYLHTIQRQVERVNKLTQRVLNLARPQPGQRQPIDVSEVVQDVLALVGKTLETKNIEVTVGRRDVPSILAAPDHLAQIFLNLIINAAEAISDSDQILIDVYPAGDEVAISFTNFGPAIPQDILPQIFDPFFTTKSEGSGLGLWLSHNLVEQYAGSLTVDNISDELGVIFTVKFPAASSPKSTNLAD